ncbi:MAG: hypothetical protein MI747_12650 [Desulfobacterales bacterium]|nr:hypothetical protein [Desulfobacterales bacterium]
MVKLFNAMELGKLDGAVLLAEELVNNHFKLSSGQWLKNRYDIKTLKELDSHEQLNGPLAQVVKYEGRQKDRELGSSTYTLYRVCLQDDRILETLDRNPGLEFEPFLIYILTHELVHVVRFIRFKHRYENTSEAEVTHGEEVRVHGITHDILFGVSIVGMDKVFEFYGEWL